MLRKDVIGVVSENQICLPRSAIAFEMLYSLANSWTIENVFSVPCYYRIPPTAAEMG